MEDDARPLEEELADVLTGGELGEGQGAAVPHAREEPGPDPGFHAAVPGRDGERDRRVLAGVEPPCPRRADLLHGRRVLLEAGEACVVRVVGRVHAEEREPEDAHRLVAGRIGARVHGEDLRADRRAGLGVRLVGLRREDAHGVDEALAREARRPARRRAEQRASNE